MLPVLQVGPLAVQLPGLLLLLGLWMASVWIGRNAGRHGLDGDVLDRLLLIGLVAGVIGARLGFVLENAPVYLEDPQGILSLNLSAFSALEGAAAGVLAAVIYGQRKGLPLWPTLDALTAGAALFSVFFALSHLASGDAFGSPADIPWGIELWGARRHPSQLYELLTSLAILLVVIRLQDRRAFAGELALGWLSLASASRLVLEAFRGDSLYLVGLRQAQLLALLVLMLSLAGLHLLARRRADAEPMRATGFPLESPSAS